MKIGKIALIIAICFMAAITVTAQQYGWRGPGRTGVYNETGLLKAWSASGPKLLWEATGMGTGYGSVTVTGDAVYITGVHGDKDVLTAYSQDGKKKWDVEYGTMSKSNYPESRCTPTYVNGRLYVISGQGELACISTEGKILWSVPYYKNYEASVPRFGISESPLVVDNKVIATPGGPKAAMVAFNIDNGKVIWETPSLKDGGQYVNPLLIEEKGMKLIVTHTAKYLIGVNAADGRLLWKYNFTALNEDTTRGRNFIHTPLYRDGFIFAANGYGQTSAKLKLSQDGKKAELVWKNPDVNPHVGGMVLVGNYIYSSTHDNNSKGVWVCADWNTGKTMWKHDWNNKGSIIYADGLLYIYEERDGNVAIIKPSPEKFDLVSSFKITKGDGPHWAHMVIDKGRLFIRHGNYLAVYSIKAK